MSVTFNKIGIHSITAELVESVEATKTMDSKMIMSTEGGFGEAKTFDPKYEFTVKGRGTTSVKAGDVSAAGYLPDYISGGRTIVTSVKLTQKNDDYNEFEISGVNYPEAGALAN